MRICCGLQTRNNGVSNVTEWSFKIQFPNVGSGQRPEPIFLSVFLYYKKLKLCQILFSLSSVSISLGFAPSGGPIIPRSSNKSRSLAARAYPTLRRR